MFIFSCSSSAPTLGETAGSDNVAFLSQRSDGFRNIGEKSTPKNPKLSNGRLFRHTHTDIHSCTQNTETDTWSQTHTQMHAQRQTHAQGSQEPPIHANVCPDDWVVCVCELSRPWKSSKQKKLSFSHLEASKISKTPPISHTYQTFRKTCGSAGRTWIGAFSQKITAVSENSRKTPRTAERCSRTSLITFSVVGRGCWRGLVRGTGHRHSHTFCGTVWCLSECFLLQLHAVVQIIKSAVRRERNKLMIEEG